LLIAIGILQGWAVCFSRPLAARIGLEYGHDWSGFASLLLQSRDDLLALLIMEILFELYVKVVLFKLSELKKNTASAHEVVYGNQDTADDIQLGLCGLSIFLGPSKSYVCVVGCVAGFVWQLNGVLTRSQLAGAIPILLPVGFLLDWETFCLDTRKPTSCGKWAKRGVQLKILMCVVLPVSLLSGTFQASKTKAE
jgi:hypothetical protein